MPIEPSLALGPYQARPKTLNFRPEVSAHITAKNGANGVVAELQVYALSPCYNYRLPDVRVGNLRLLALPAKMTSKVSVGVLRIVAAYVARPIIY
jgi:hypothetical protein